MDGEDASVWSTAEKTRSGAGGIFFGVEDRSFVKRMRYLVDLLPRDQWEEEI